MKQELQVYQDIFTRLKPHRVIPFKAFFPLFNGFSPNFSLCCPVSYDPGLDYSRSDSVTRPAGQYRGSVRSERERLRCKKKERENLASINSLFMSWTWWNHFPWHLVFAASVVSLFLRSWVVLCAIWGRWWRRGCIGKILHFCPAGWADARPLISLLKLSHPHDFFFSRLSFFCLISIFPLQSCLGVEERVIWGRWINFQFWQRQMWRHGRKIGKCDWERAREVT